MAAARGSAAARPGIPGLQAVLGSWSSASRHVARSVMEQYGPPDEMTPSQLVWYKNGLWKRTVAFRDGSEHAFPRPHRDLLLQVLNYAAPLDKFDLIPRFNGSITLDRTRGEMASRCDEEATNFLMMNLAHDVATDVRTVDEAREYAAQKLLRRRAGEADDYLVSIQFVLEAGDVGDPDESVEAAASAPNRAAPEDVAGRARRLRRSRPLPGAAPGARD